MGWVLIVAMFTVGQIAVYSGKPDHTAHVFKTQEECQAMLESEMKDTFKGHEDEVAAVCVPEKEYLEYKKESAKETKMKGTV